MEELIEQMRVHLPPVFRGTALDDLTGNALCWRTIQNKRSRREIPEACFLYDGRRRLLVQRDAFLAWWKSTLSGKPAVECRQAVV